MRQIWTKGRRGCNACIEVSLNNLSVIATAESDHITPHQMLRALNKEFPRHTFYNISDDDHLRMGADRWTNDGLTGEQDERL